MNNYERIIKPHNQAMLIFITSFLLIFLTYLSLQKFRNLDPSPSIQPISQHNSGIIGIPTGFYLRNFLDFDIIKNEFTAEGILWFIIDPNKISLKELGKFYFSKGSLIKSAFLTNGSLPIIKKLSENKQLVQYDLRIKFSSNMNYRLFPLDSHRLYLTLTNKYLSANQYYFDIKPENFLISETLFTFGWNNISNYFQTGLTKFNLTKNQDLHVQSYPRMIFAMDFKLSSIRNILLIFMPLFIVFFMSLFSFSFDPSKNKETIMSISAAVVPAILGYRFVIEAVSPRVTYFMLSDQIFNLFLLLSFLIFFINEFYLAKIRAYRGLLVLSFHIGLVVSWYYLLFHWV